MTEFGFTEEQLMLRDMARDFVNNEIKPIAAKIDADEKIPPELIKQLGELGFLGVAFPEEYGGGGFGEVGYCLMQEEMARGCMSTATFIGAHQSIGSNVIYLGGREEQKQKYLAPLAKGEKIGAFCLTEAQAGSDSFNVKTRARLDGNEWVINGEKLWITNGGIADIVSVFARTEKGVSAFIVETNTPKPNLPAFKVFIARINPRPSTPMRFSFGIRTLSNVIAFVELPFIPIFFSAGPA